MDALDRKLRRRAILVDESRLVAALDRSGFLNEIAGRISGRYCQEELGIPVGDLKMYSEAAMRFDSTFGAINTSLNTFVLAPQSRSLLALHSIEKNASCFEEYRDALVSSPIFQRFTRRPLSPENLDSYFASLNKDLTADLENRLFAFTKPRGLAFDLHQDVHWCLRIIQDRVLRSLAAPYSLKMQNFSASAISLFVERMQTLLPVHSSIIDPYIENFQENFATLKERPFNRQGFSLELFVNHRDVTDILLAMDATLPGYCALQDEQGVKVLTLLRTNAQCPIFVNAVGENLAVFVDNDGNKKELIDLVSKSPISSRWEFFETLCQNPKFLTIYRFTKRANVSPADFANTVLEISDAPEEKRAPIVEWLDDAMANPLTVPKESISLVMKKPWRIAQDSRYDDLLTILREHRLGHILVDNYLSAQDDGLPKRAALFLDIARLPLPPEKLKLIRLKIQDGDEESLDAVLRLPDEDKLRAISRLGQKNFAYSRTKNGNGTTWGSYLKEQVKSDFPDISPTLDLAYELLPKDVKHRLRTAWNRGIPTFTTFCSDVAAFHRVPEYAGILANTQIFSRYMDVIESGDDSYRSRLQNGAPRSFREMLDLFPVIQKSQSHSDSVSSSTTPLSSSAKNNQYARVLVWGGRYDPVQERRLQDEIELPLMLMHYSTHMPRPREIIRSDDLVVFVTSLCAHPDYYAVKAAVGRTGATLYHCNHENIGLIAETIRHCLVK